MTRYLVLITAAGLAASCSQQPSAPDAPPPSPASSTPAIDAAAPPEPHPAPREPVLRTAAPLAAGLVRSEWTMADNRDVCAPLAFTTDGGAPGKARRAEFSGGWAVAFDTPGVRSAYGLAGVGALDSDGDPPAAQEQRLRAQWPHFMRLPDLPGPAFAGFGVEGASDYPPSNADGRGLNSLAYVRVGGQSCSYNVWSRLGRAHLEVLLGSLRLLEGAG